MSLPKQPKNTPDDDYHRRSQQRHKEYSAAYSEWLASLTPEERKLAEACGVGSPEPDTHRVSGHAPGEDRDAAESNLSRVGFDFRSLDAAPATPAARDTWEDPGLHLQRIVGSLISAENVRVSVIALAFAMNLDALNGLGSIREAAAAIGVSPEAISKKKRQWEEDLRIPPNAFAKSNTAKLALSLAQQTKHWKKTKWKAPHAHHP